MITKLCKECGKEFQARSNKRKFCDTHCAGKYNRRLQPPMSDETRLRMSLSKKKQYKEDSGYKQRVADGVKKWVKENPDKVSRGDKHAKAVANYTKGKFNPSPLNMHELSGRTRSKVIKRLKLKCCICGWDEDACDLHHIHGRKIDDPHNHNNLTVLCPNHHRLATSGKISVDKFITLEEQVGDKWLEAYYG